MRISNNNAAFNVWKNYSTNLKGLQKSMGKLSSGSRINNAGDDPSGLAMSERLRTQARNTAAASSNVENRLNYLQTADSWMQKIHDMLGRMGELSVMANDGTKSQTDLDVLQKEFKQMQDEITRIVGVDAAAANSAGKFNGKTLFNGSLVELQVGADGGQEFSDGAVLDLTLDSAETLSGGTNWADLINSDPTGSGLVAIADVDTDGDGTPNALSGDAGAAVGLVNEGIDYISEKRADVGAEMKRMQHTLDGLRNYEENISAAEGRIRDVDVAKETATMSKFQILQQVGTAMLAQANQLPQNVMQLFG